MSSGAMIARFKNGISILVIIGCGAYLAVKGYRDNQQALTVATQAAEAEASSSKLDNLRSLTEGALNEQRAKLASLDQRVAELTNNLEQARQERAVVQTSVKNMEKVFATLGLPETAPATQPASAATAAVVTAQAAKASQPSTPVVQVAAPAVVSVGDSKLTSIVEQINATAGKQLARASDENNVAISGSGLVLFDKNRPRIGQKALTSVMPLLQQLRGWKVKGVTVKVSKSAPASHVKVIKNFIERQYGWKADIEEVSDQAATLAPIEINVSGW